MAQMRNSALQEPLLYGQAVSNSISVKNRRICCITVVAMGLVCLPVIIIIGLGLFVIAPRVIQNELQKAELQANFISITHPIENGFSIAINASLSLPDSYVVYTKPAIVELLYGNSVITAVTMDAMEVSGSVNLFFNSTSIIRDEHAFASFTKDLVTNPSIEIGFRSTVDVVPVSNLFGNLAECSVLLEKNIILTGFGGIKPIVKSFSILGGDESAFHITSSFDVINPTIFSLNPIGVLTFDLSSDSVHIGRARSSSSWSVVPGLNQDLSIIGTIAPSTDSEIAKVAEIMQSLANSRNVTMSATSSPPYSSEAIYARGLANITVEFEMPSTLINPL